MKVFLIYIFFFFSISCVYSQRIYSWKVYDKESSELIKNATCYLNKIQVVKDSNNIFTFSDTLNTNSYFLEIRSVNYVSQKYFLSTLNEIENAYYLERKKSSLKTIIINKKDEASQGQILTIKEVEKLPTFLGENDLVKAIQLLPGIQSSGDGNGIFVRGGGIDQNLILYDEVPLYNISHLFGFFSVFNSNAISSVDIFKSGIPANYGGRVSSVIGIRSETGNFKNWKGEVGVGILASNVSIQGPIKKDTSSLLLAFRRTYVDLFTGLINSNSNYLTNYYFYDFNFNYTHKLNTKNRLEISGLSGKDDFLYNDRLNNTFSNSINWQTQLISTQLTSTISDKLQVKTILGLVNYNMKFGASIYNYSLDLESKINDYSLKNEWKYNHHTNATFRAGIEIINHHLAPNNFSVQGKNSDTRYNNSLKLNSFEYNVFAFEHFKIREKLNLEMGVRYSFFHQLGPFQRLNFNEVGVTDTVFYPKGKTLAFYHNPEPRIHLSFDLSDDSQLKLGYSTNYQYLHLAPVSSISLPTDVWVPSSEIIKPQVGRQISLGYATSFFKRMIQFSTEVYYKKMQNLIEYKEGVMSLVSMQSNYDNNFYFGQGESYGIEFLIKKKVGKWNGWIGYTLSKSTRKFPDIENNRTFFAKNDRRHDISTVLNYDINDRWSISSVFVFKSGNALTIPLARYILQGNVINTYSPKNSYRIAPYHRMDFSVNYILSKREKYSQTLNFSVYNLYGRQNPFYIYFETTGDLSKFAIQTKAKQVSLFTILPSISWKIAFN